MKYLAFALFCICFLPNSYGRGNCFKMNLSEVDYITVSINEVIPIYLSSDSSKLTYMHSKISVVLPDSMKIVFKDIDVCTRNPCEMLSGCLNVNTTPFAINFHGEDQMLASMYFSCGSFNEGGFSIGTSSVFNYTASYNKELSLGIREFLEKNRKAFSQAIKKNKH